MPNLSQYGSSEIQEDTKYVVSYWYLPGGYDAVNAESRNLFCSMQELAEKACEEIGTYPPEMAFVISIEDYLRVKENSFNG